MENKFYVYALLDPRESGNFNYDNLDLSFRYKPFYIGKGGTPYQLFSHLKQVKNGKIDKHNPRKSYTIRNMLVENVEPIIIKIKDNLNESMAFQLEIFYIINIGRKDLYKGPLLNLSFGGEGTSGYKWTKEQKNKHSIIQKKVCNDPEVKRRRTKSTIKSHSNKEYKEKARSIAIELQSDKDRRNRNIQANKDKWKDKDFREWRTSLQKEIMSKPEVRLNNSRAQKIAQNRPEVILKKRLIALNYYRKRNKLSPLKMDDIIEGGIYAS